MFWYHACSYVACGLISFWLVTKLIWKSVILKCGFIYCPSNVPIFGSTLYLESHSHKPFKQHKEFFYKGNHVYLMWFSWDPIIHASKAEYPKIVLGSQVNLRKSRRYKFLHEWLHSGLLTSCRPKRKHRRRLITPSYHFSILNEFVPIFEKHANGSVKKFVIAANEQKVIDIQSVIKLTTLEAICKTSVGIDNVITENAVDYTENMAKFEYHIRSLANVPWLWPQYTIFSSSRKYFYHSLNSIHNFTVNAINQYI